MEKKGLGRGLSALLADVSTEPSRSNGPPPVGQRTVPIDRIRANPHQPRRSFDDRDLQDLAASIRTRGVIQPLILRPHPTEDDVYEIVAGERRWRAAQLAELHELPAVVRDLDDSEVLELAIIENVQRADLNAVEEAQGYRQLMDRFGHTQERLAEGLGKSRSHIANVLRLLSLPDTVLEHLRAGRLTAGHARALVTAANPEALAKQVIDRGLSVRQTEALAREAVRPDQAPRPKASKDADTRALEADLSANLRLPVAIDHKAGGRGELRIRYANLDELDGLCQLLGR
jgi:ParB family chromosome partitioning protein